MSWKCPYCQTDIAFEPGTMMIEENGDTKVVHEECYQLSGDDEGYVERLHQILEKLEDE